jgi:hypothetical protein
MAVGSASRLTRTRGWGALPSRPHLSLQMRCRVAGMKPGWTHAPRDQIDPYRRQAELIAELLQEGYPVTVLIGFEKEPKSLDSEIKRLGGVELCTRMSSGNTTFFKLGSRWRRFLFRLELAYHRLVRRTRRGWVIRT